MIKSLLFLAILVVSGNVWAQTSDYDLGGTLIVGVICENGILVESDSRTTIIKTNPDGSTTTFAYYDSTRKIFQINNHLFAIAGIDNIDGHTLSHIITNFSKTIYYVNSGADLINRFISYCKAKYSDYGFQHFIKKIFILSAGIDKGVPVIYTYSTTNTPPIIPIYQGYQIIPGNGINDLNNIYQDNHFLTGLSEAVEQYINEFPSKHDIKYAIGGQVQIAEISNNGSIKFVKNELPISRFENITQLNKAFCEHRFIMKYADGSNFKKTKSALDSMSLFYLK